jgi:hypothetical protein
MTTRKGFVQRYNDQAAVTADQIIAGVHIGQNPTTKPFHYICEKCVQMAEAVIRTCWPSAAAGAPRAAGGR